MKIFTKKKPVVFVADDDKVTLELLGQLVTDQGYELLSATDGTEAYRKIFEYKPDLIIIDNYMPGMSGREICKEVKENPATRLIPVVIITGYSATVEKLGAIEAGADDFISKPYKTIELLTRIRALLHAKFLNDELDSAEGVIFALARAIEAKDSYTQGHTERVSSLALLIGHQLKLSEEEQKALYKGGILHDIGKIAVPDAILNKPSRLDESEFEKIKLHPDHGEKICKHLKSIRSALEIIRHHHEKLDGSGYPDQLSGEKIPLTARIMSIVDVYDALTTERPYKHPLSQEEALSVLTEETEKGWWDAKVLNEVKIILKKT